MSTLYSSPMVTKNTFCIIILLGFSILFMGCPKECVSPERSFVAYYNILNLKQKYDLGDTLWIESKLDCMNMLNLVSNANEEFCGKKISSTMYLNQMIDSLKPIAPLAFNKFEFLNVDGEVFNDPSAPRAYQIQFDQIENFYKVHFGLICKDTGAYILHVHLGGVFGNSHCDRAGLDQVFSTNERNLDLYLEYIYPNTDSEFGLRNKYVFQVK